MKFLNSLIEKNIKNLGFKNLKDFKKKLLKNKKIKF